MDKGKYCQSKSHVFKLLFALFALVYLFSCSRLEVEDAAPVSAKPVWFVGPSDYQWDSGKGEAKVHPFYDMVPFSSSIDQSINFYPLFAPDSAIFRDFDPISGESFGRMPFCPRGDIWKKSNKELNRPNFTYGIIPRLVDQLGQIQNIVVFGNDDLYRQEVERKSLVSHRVRVVGGVLHQYCDEYPCGSEDEWRSRLVLIAVDSSDSKFSKVRDWSGLKEVVDWPKARVFLENLYGGTLTAELIKPAYRVSGEIDGKASLDAAVKKGHLFRFEEIMTLRKSCHLLYDYVWDNIVQLRQRKDGNLKKSKFRSFSEFFADFYPRYGAEYRTCVSRVHHATLNSNLKRFWFFAYFDGFFHQERLGQVYRCNEGVWMRNPIDPLTNKTIYDGKKIYPNCTDSQLDRAFESISMNAMGNANAGNPYLRFIEYDSGVNGTHERLYSWVNFTGKSYLCRNKKRVDYAEVKDFDFFPKDIYWERFGNAKKKLMKTNKSQFDIED